MFTFLEEPRALTRPSASGDATTCMPKRLAPPTREHACPQRTGPRDVGCVTAPRTTQLITPLACAPCRRGTVSTQRVLLVL